MTSGLSNKVSSLRSVVRAVRPRTVSRILALAKLILRPGGVALGLALIGFRAIAADTPANNSESATNAPPRSIFDLKASTVKDPFFPLTTRTPFPVAVVPNAAPAQVNPTWFKLQALVASVSQPLAVINDHAFAPGEKASIRPATDSTNKVAVLLQEIRGASVVIKVDGLSQPVELFLAPKDR